MAMRKEIKIILCTYPRNKYITPCKMDIILSRFLWLSWIYDGNDRDSEGNDITKFMDF